MEETQNTKSEEGLDAQMDVSSLYREQTFTDRKVGIITTLTPVLPDGSDDKSRSVIYSGEAHIMTQMGSLPLKTMEPPPKKQWKRRFKSFRNFAVRPPANWLFPGSPALLRHRQEARVEAA